MDLNTVTITGRLTATPELRYTNDAKPVANLRVAVNGRSDRTDFIDVTVWGKPAETVAEHKAKGDQIGITGRLTTSEWTTDDGARHWRTSVTADEVVFLDTPRLRTNSGKATPNSPRSAERASAEVAGS
jgi:single-strand DNA-binding protein